VGEMRGKLNRLTSRIDTAHERKRPENLS
jgi:hypothetical protein